MKTTMFKSVQFNFTFILMLLLLLGSSCDKDDSSDSGDDTVEQNNGISEDELDNYEGDLGILINTRDLVKKGYSPSKVYISTNAEEGDYNQLLDVDPFNSLAQLSYSVEDLSEAAEDELRNGVELTVQVVNESNETIITESFSVVSFEENGNEIDIDASTLAFVQLDLEFKEGLQHYLQVVDQNGNFSNAIVWKPSSAQDNNVILEERNSSFNRGTTSEQYLIYKFPGQENTFTMWSANTGRYLATDSNDQSFRQSGAFSYPDGISDNSLHVRYRFKIKREDNGLYTINDINGNPMRQYSQNGKRSWRATNSGIIQYFRIMALDINWEAQELETQHLQPIFPAVETSFGFNSTLRNCGAGSLEQEVGIESSVTTTYSTSFSESIGLSSRLTTSVDVSVSATAEASFFGNGGSVTGEVSAGIELSTEASSTTTTGNETTDSETTTVSSTRTVVVPAGSASLVYDAYQTYSDVRVPYVKRLRLRGTDSENGSSLSGDEILTQLRVTSFSGTVTNVGSDFVEITVQGNMYLDNIVDTQTEVRDVPANCG
jgi:hypothetical protein